MKTQKLLLLVVLLSSLAAQSGRAQRQVQIERIFVSASLSGHIYMVLSRVPADGVTVELCSSAWQAVIASTKTDASGYFALAKPPGSLFYMRVSSYGLQTLRIRVRIKKHATKDLTLEVENAT
jgi:hypothetical protein